MAYTQQEKDQLAQLRNSELSVEKDATIKCLDGYYLITVTEHFVQGDTIQAQVQSQYIATDEEKLRWKLEDIFATPPEQDVVQQDTNARPR